MQTKTIDTYTYDELSAAAQATARDWWREGKSEHYERSDEALESLRKLASHFSGNLVDYSIDFTDSSPSYAKVDMPDDMEEAEIKRRLKALGTFDRKTLKGHGDCKLTGVCHDEDAIDGFRIAFMRNGERDLTALMQSAFENWLKVCQEDCAYLDGDEAVAENLRANDYAFTVEGKRSVTL